MNLRVLLWGLLVVGSSTGAARAEDLGTRLGSGTPIVCAHRGWLSPTETENSLATFRRTARAGRFMLEMDLATTRDGVIVLMHDTRVDRTTDGHGTVADLTDAEIRRLHLRTHAGQLAQDAPPRLQAVLDWAARTPGILLMLDIKRTPPDAVMVQVRAAGLTRRVLLLTFDADTAARSFAADPAVLVSVLTSDDASLAGYRRMAGPHRPFAAYIPATSPGTLFDHAHRAGAVIVTDLLDRRDALQPGPDTAALQGRPADIVVSNRPRATARDLDAR